MCTHYQGTMFISKLQKLELQIITHQAAIKRTRADQVVFTWLFGKPNSNQAHESRKGILGSPALLAGKKSTSSLGRNGPKYEQFTSNSHSQQTT